MVKLKIAGAIFLTLCYKTPLASELTHVQLHLAAFNHHFFKHTLSDLRKGNPRADEHLRKHDHHLCRCNTFFRTGIFRHLKRRKPHQRVRTHKLGNDCSRNCNHRTRSRIHFCLQSRLEGKHAFCKHKRHPCNRTDYCWTYRLSRSNQLEQSAGCCNLSCGTVFY